ncbi:aldose 1-epimerase family protein [Glutamicibacter arilaitensis]|uniref:aldose 1-epimerase family protein n=1 Tax=Glutamicibacter arilaitensis TaxID=256701 RepID=UPI00385017B8
MKTKQRPALPTANGQLINLEAHGYSAQIASVGATVVSLEYLQRPLVRTFDPQQLRPVYSGAILAPWPNRVIDGRYRWSGTELQLPLSEVARRHALHGLVFSSDFSILSQSDDRVELQVLVPKQEGYPFALLLNVSYQLEATGLRSTINARNLGTEHAPYGFGSHCYLVAPGRSVDGWLLEMPADRVQQVSGERLLPQEVVAVEGTELDFRKPRRIAQTFVDHAFTGLRMQEGEQFRVQLTDADGVGSYLSWDEKCPWVQVHTADQADPQLHRTGLAVEPMSCPPGAFNDGTDVISLAPGASHHASWIIGALQPA